MRVENKEKTKEWGFVVVHAYLVKKIKITRLLIIGYEKKNWLEVDFLCGKKKVG